MTKTLEESLADLYKAASTAEIFHCEVCGGQLEPSEFGGFIHIDNNHNDHAPRGGSLWFWSMLYC